MTDHFKRAEAGFKPLFALEAAIRASTLEKNLLHLVKLRASQINACAFCIQMHTAEALTGEGETPLALITPVLIDGLTGFVSRIDGTPQTTALQVEDGRITAIYITRNPDKLGSIAALRP